MTLSTYVKVKLYTEVWFDAQQHYNYEYIFIMLFIFHYGLKRMDHLQLDNDHWINCTNHNERITFHGILQCHNIETLFTLNSSARISQKWNKIHHTQQLKFNFQPTETRKTNASHHFHFDYICIRPIFVKISILDVF